MPGPSQAAAQATKKKQTHHHAPPNAKGSKNNPLGLVLYLSWSLFSVSKRCWNWFLLFCFLGLCSFDDVFLNLCWERAFSSELGELRWGGAVAVASCSIADCGVGKSYCGSSRPQGRMSFSVILLCDIPRRSQETRGAWDRFGGSKYLLTRHLEHLREIRSTP